MIKSKRKILAMVALFSAVTLVSCGPSETPIVPDNKASTYTMEAEYIDLDNVKGAGLSSEQSGVSMIYGDGTEAQKNLGWSSGYYVGYTYNPLTALEFAFESDIETTTTIVLRLGSELGNITIDPNSLGVVMNETTINYQGQYIENSKMESMVFSDKTISSKVTIKKGKNSLFLKIRENTLRNGNATGGPTIDCIKLITAGKLTWTEKKDNPSRRGEI
jgi:hypothetical protein